MSSYLHDTPPKLTFYDEMIDLLKEKLDDPDNYATVADTAGGVGAAAGGIEVEGGAEDNNEECLYMDPKNRVEDAEKKE